MTTVMGISLFMPPLGVGLFIVLGIAGSLAKLPQVEDRRRGAPASSRIPEGSDRVHGQDIESASGR